MNNLDLKGIAEDLVNTFLMAGKIAKEISDRGAKITIKADKYSFSVHGNGSKKLTLKHPKDIVLRKSAFTCTRTLAINCDKASSDIPREMIHVLQNPKIIGKMIIEVE